MSIEEDWPDLKRWREAPNAVSKTQLTETDIYLLRPQYWDGFLIFTVLSQWLLVSGQDPALQMSPSVIKLFYLLKKNQFKWNSLMLMAGTENEGALPIPALFSGWETFLFSLWEISMEKKVDRTKCTNWMHIKCLVPLNLFGGQMMAVNQVSWLPYFLYEELY